MNQSDKELLEEQLKNAVDVTEHFQAGVNFGFSEALKLRQVQLYTRSFFSAWAGVYMYEAVMPLIGVNFASILLTAATTTLVFYTGDQIANYFKKKPKES